MSEEHTDPTTEATADLPEDDDAASVAHHDAATHMDAHTTISDDDHGHAEEALGPIDWGAWAVALVSGAAGLLVAALFWVAVN